MPKRGLGILGALTLAFAGLIGLRGGAAAMGLVLGVAGAILFVLTVRSIEKADPAEALQAGPNPHNLTIPLSLWVAGLVLTLWVVANVITPPQATTQGRLVAAAWVVSVVLHVAGTLTAIRWTPPTAASVLAWTWVNRKELVLVGGLTLVAMVLRLAGLSAHPYPWSGDEAAIGHEGVRILQGNGRTFFGTGWSGQPVWSFLPTALSVAIFGHTILATRIVSALAGTLTIPALYVLGRLLFNRSVAFLAAVALIAYPYHLQFSRLGVNNVNDGLISVIVLGMSYYALERGGVAAFTATGVAIGLTIYTYVGSRLVLALAVLIFLSAIVTRRGWLQAHLRRLAALTASALVTLLPMAVFFVRNPQVFMTRINQAGILQNGWMAVHLEQGGQTMWRIWVSQFSKSTLVYIAQPALSNFLNFDRPYLTAVGALSFLLGMAYALYRFRTLRYLIILVWFWSVVILGSVLMVDPPANTRMVMAIPPTALFVGLGLEKVFGALPRAGLLSPQLSRIICAVLIGLVVLQGAVFYFGKYRTADMFSDANSEVAAQIANELHELGPDYDLYLLGAPRVFVSFPTISYVNPANQLVDLKDLQTNTLEGIDHGRGLLFVAIPERKESLTVIASRIGGGEWQTFQRRGRAEALYYAYVVAPP